MADYTNIITNEDGTGYDEAYVNNVWGVKDGTHGGEIIDVFADPKDDINEAKTKSSDVYVVENLANSGVSIYDTGTWREDPSEDIEVNTSNDTLYIKSAENGYTIYFDVVSTQQQTDEADDGGYSHILDYPLLITDNKVVTEDPNPYTNGRIDVVHTDGEDLSYGCVKVCNCAIDAHPNPAPDSPETQGLIEKIRIGDKLIKMSALEAKRDEIRAWLDRKYAAATTDEEKAVFYNTCSVMNSENETAKAELVALYKSITKSALELTDRYSADELTFTKSGNDLVISHGTDSETKTGFFADPLNTTITTFDSESKIYEINEVADLNMNYVVKAGDGAITIDGTNAGDTIQITTYNLINAGSVKDFFKYVKYEISGDDLVIYYHPNGDSWGGGDYAFDGTVDTNDKLTLTDFFKNSHELNLDSVQLQTNKSEGTWSSRSIYNDAFITSNLNSDEMFTVPTTGYKLNVIGNGTNTLQFTEAESLSDLQFILGGTKEYDLMIKCGNASVQLPDFCQYSKNLNELIHNIKIGENTFDLSETGIDVELSGANAYGSRLDDRIAYKEGDTSVVNAIQTRIGNDTIDLRYYTNEGFLNLSGGEGNDKIYAGSSTTTTLNGGVGNDEIHGGTSKDTILIYKGDGQDNVYDVSSEDIIRYEYTSGQDADKQVETSTDINSLVFNRSGDNLIVVNGNDSITLNGFFNSTNPINTIQSHVLEDKTFTQRTDELNIKTDALINYELSDGEVFDANGYNYNFTFAEGATDVKVSKLGENSKINLTGETEYSFSDKGLTVVGSANTITISDNTTGKTDLVYVGTTKDDVSNKVLEVTKLNNFDASSLGYKNVEITGTDSADNFTGSTGDDTIYGKAGADVINGGAGKDEIQGGAGDDIIDGGTGADTFMYEANGTSFGHDTIKNATADDVIKFSIVKDTITFDGEIKHKIESTAKFSDLVFEKSGNDLLIKIKDNTADDIKVEGFFTAGSKIDKIFAAENRTYSNTNQALKEYSIKDDAVINVEITQAGEYSASDYKEAYTIANGIAGNVIIHNLDGQKDSIKLNGVDFDDITFLHRDGRLDMAYGSTLVLLAGYDSAANKLSSITTNDGTYDFAVGNDATEFSFSTESTGNNIIIGALDGDKLNFTNIDKSKVAYARNALGDLVITTDKEGFAVTLKGFFSADVHKSAHLDTIKFNGLDDVSILKDAEINVNADSYFLGYNVVNDDATAEVGGYKEIINVTSGNLSTINIDDAVLEAISSGDITKTHDDAGYHYKLALGKDKELASIIVGQLGDDTIYDSVGNDYLAGANGVDKIYSTKGEDALIGGEGADYLYAKDNTSDVEIYGGAGADEINSGSGNDFIWGGSGSDEIHLNGGNNRIILSDVDFGSDTIYGATANDKLEFVLRKGGEVVQGYNFSELSFAKKGNDLEISAGSSKATISGFFTADSKVDTIVTKDGEKYIKNDVVFDVVLDSEHPTFDKATSGYGDYKVAVSGTGSVTNLGANDKIATSGQTVKYMRENDGGLIVWSGNGELQTDKITVTDFNFDGQHDINVNNGTTENMILNVDLDGTVTYAATSYTEIFSGVGSVTGFVNSKDGVVPKGSPVLIRENNSTDLSVDGITIKNFDFSTSNPFRIFDGNTSTQSTDYPIYVTLFDVGGEPTEYQSTGYKEYIDGKGIVNLSGDHPFDRSQDAVYVDGWSDIHYTRENNWDLHVVQGDDTDITVKGFNFAGGTDFNVTDGKTTELTKNITIDVTLTGIIGDDYHSASGYAERITTKASTAIQFAENSDKDTLVFDTTAANIEYLRDGNNLVITNSADEDNIITTTIKNYYTSGDMSVAGQFAGVKVDTKSADTTLGNLSVTEIEKVSYFDSGDVATDKDETVYLVKGLKAGDITDAEKLARDTQGVVKLNDNNYEYTSNVGRGTHTLDSYAMGRAGKDNIYGTDGNDWIHGGDGDDYIYGGKNGADMLAGGDGNDHIYAKDEDGNLNTTGVELYGGAGNDTLVGGAGNDYIWGGAGTNTLTGGAGADTFDFTVEGTADAPIHDTITDATSADTIAIYRKGFADLKFTQESNDLLISVDANNTLTVQGYFSNADKVTKFEVGGKVYTLGWHDGAMYNEIRNTDDKIITAVSGIRNWIDGQSRDEFGKIITGGDKYDMLAGTQNADTITAGANGAEIYGDAGNDTITATNSFIVGGSGTDTINVSGGNNTICFANTPGVNGTESDPKAFGTDTVNGVTAGDTLKFSLGGSLLGGYKLSDLSFANVDGDLVITAKNGDEINTATITGYFANNVGAIDFQTLNEAGNEQVTNTLNLVEQDGKIYNVSKNPEANIVAGIKNWVNGYVTGKDGVTLEGKTDGDMLAGTQNADTISTTVGAEIYGDAGNDTITATNSFIVGGSGTDTITVSGGNNTICFANTPGEHGTESDPKAFGTDTVNGVTAGDTLKFSLGGSLLGGYKLSDLSFANVDGDLVITAGENKATITGYFANNVGAIKFQTLNEAGNEQVTNTLNLVEQDGEIFNAVKGTSVEETIALVDGIPNLISGSGKVSNLGSDDRLVFDSVTTYALDKTNGLTILDGTNSITVTAEGRIGLPTVYVGNAPDDITGKTLKVTGFSTFDASEVGFEKYDITGTDAADTLTGGNGADTIKGGKGDDTIYGGEGNDDLTGGKGKNTIYTGTGNDDVDATEGANTIYVDGYGHKEITSGSNEGNTFVFSKGTAVINDATAKDTIKFATLDPSKVEFVKDGYNLVIRSLVEGDEDTITIGDYFKGHAITKFVLGKTTLNLEYRKSNVDGKSYLYNVITGTDEDVEIPAIEGIRNWIDAGPNDNTVTGGDKIDMLAGNDGADVITASNPAEIFGGAGADGIYALGGNSFVAGGLGDDTITVSGGNNTIAFVDTTRGKSAKDFGMDVVDGAKAGDVLKFSVDYGDTIQEIDGYTFDDLYVEKDGTDLIVYAGERDEDGNLPNNKVVLTDYFTQKEEDRVSAIQALDKDGETYTQKTRPDELTALVNKYIYAPERTYDEDKIEAVKGQIVIDKNAEGGEYKINAAEYVSETAKGITVNNKNKLAGLDITGSLFNDTITTKNDVSNTIIENGGTNKITTGNADDVVIAEDYSNNTINVGAGENTVTLNSTGINKVTASNGNNDVNVYAGSNNIKLGNGANEIGIAGGVNTVKTGKGANDVFITDGVNKVTTGKGKDEFILAGGNNTIKSATGEDVYNIVDGYNTIKTGNAATTFTISDSYDIKDGNVTVATVEGDGGVNVITSGSKNDIFNIDAGVNTIKSGSGVDTLNLNGGKNIVDAGAGEDVFFINSGKNTLNGAKGNDRYEVDLTDFDFNAGQIVVTDTAGKNILNAVVDSTDGKLDTLNVFFDVTVKTNKSGTKFKGATYSNMVFSTDDGANITTGDDTKGFDEIVGIDVSSKKAFTTINTSNGATGEDALSHSATISTKQLDKLASDVAGWLFDKGYASTDDVFANEKTDGDIAYLVAKYTTFSANDYKMQ